MSASVRNQAQQSPAQRRQKAQDLVSRHRGELSRHRRLDVRCERNHHVASIYDFDGELVYAARVGGHSHGSRDRADEGHAGSRRGQRYAELFRAPEDEGAEDPLPAGCECGGRSLPPQLLRAALVRNERSLILG